VSGKPVAVPQSARSIPQQVINEESGPDGDVLVTFKITFRPTRTLIFDTFGWSSHLR